MKNLLQLILMVFILFIFITFLFVCNQEETSGAIQLIGTMVYLIFSYITIPDFKPKK